MPSPPLSFKVVKYEKLDAPLAASLAVSNEARLAVFVSLKEPLNNEAKLFFEALGFVVRPNARVTTGLVSKSAIADLSELNCVRSIKLSGSSRLAGPAAS